MDRAVYFLNGEALRGIRVCGKINKKFVYNIKN